MLATKLNGVDVSQLQDIVEMIKQDPAQAKFEFKLQNRWMTCGHNRSTVSDFYGAKQVNARPQPFVLDADEPQMMLGEDAAPNPVEHLLHALASCLTTTLIYHAAARNIQIEELTATLEGELDLRGLLGIDNSVRKGYQNIRVNFKVKSDAPPEKLKELCQFSPVFDVVSHGTNVAIDVQSM